MCIHVRRTDFVTNQHLSMLPSTIEFILPALNYVLDLARKEFNDKAISIVLFSDDSDFLKGVVEKFRVCMMSFI